MMLIAGVSEMKRGIGGEGGLLGAVIKDFGAESGEGSWEYICASSASPYGTFVTN